MYLKKIENIKEMVDEKYLSNKNKTAVTINKENYIRNINYYNYKFDIYSMVRALTDKRINIKNTTVAIISENRYEWLVTYLANSILGNNIIIFNRNCTSNMIEKTIKKLRINTIFFSEKYKDKVNEALKSEINIKSNPKKKNKNSKINLINFDSNNNPNNINYEKLMNTGRYIENYTIDKDTNNNELKQVETTFISKDGKKIVSQQELITSTIRIKDALKIWNKKNKKINATDNINTVYELIMQCLLPYCYGINTYYYNDNISKKDISIENTMQNELIFTYKNKRYRVNGSEESMALTRIENNKKLSNFIIIKNKKSVVREKLESGSKDLVLIKTGK